MIGQEGALELQQLLVHPPRPLCGHLRVELSHQLLRTVQRQLGHPIPGLCARGGAVPAIAPVGDDVDLARADVVSERAHARLEHTADLLGHDEHVQWPGRRRLRRERRWERDRGWRHGQPVPAPPRWGRLLRPPCEIARQVAHHLGQRSGVRSIPVEQRGGVDHPRARRHDVGLAPGAQVREQPRHVALRPLDRDPAPVDGRAGVVERQRDVVRQEDRNAARRDRRVDASRPRGRAHRAEAEVRVLHLTRIRLGIHRRVRHYKRGCLVFVDARG
mmetsp:Transcript_24070/g.77695  ORF Transcript_24070/g.77695 Transcript_24070/m.77695 type:complete len:274 (+) Transcript_24070:779-1600(+)